MDTGSPFGGKNPEINSTGQEQAPMPGGSVGFEQLPPPQGIEAPLQAGNETEQAISNQEAQPVASPSPQPLPLASQPASVQLPASSPDKLPTVTAAGHSNRIERTWLERGDKIIQETKDDPHGQKEQLDNLKEEYQTARYGGGDAK